jgi:hypothetical protein
MRFSRQILFPIAAVILMVSVPFGAKAQSRLTYPEISTALSAKLPNQSFQNKPNLIYHHPSQTVGWTNR